MRSSYRERRLHPVDRTNLLSSVLDAARHSHEKGPPVIVFDLDGTLLDNRPRFVRILHELADDWQTKYPEAAQKCRSATVDQIVYGLYENLERVGVTDPLLCEAAFEFWKARFFRDAHIEHDVPVPGAVEFVRQCHGEGASIVYLTGRDLPNMALGTFANLRDRGFPIGEINTSLVLKPDFDTPDTDFKRAVMPTFARVGEVVAAFDNEPANNNLFLEFHPHAKSIFLDTQHAPNPPPLDPRVLVIESFALS